MKKDKATKMLLIASIISLTGVGMATDKDINKDINKSENLVAKGTTVGHYQKPGAPVDLTYKTTRVAVGEIADINITLSTPLKSGEMEVQINFDKDLEPIGTVYESMTFPLSNTQNNYNINLQAKGKKDGLYYIRLLVKIENEQGANMRALAVPVYIGDGRLKRQNTHKIIKALSGENISVSKAKETIEIIK